jgi:hypothetical protein
MADTTDLLSFAVEKNPVDFADTFNQLIQQKAQDAIENHRVTLAQSIYGEQEATDDVEFDDDIEDDIDDSSEDDIDDEFDDEELDGLDFDELDLEDLEDLDLDDDNEDITDDQEDA